MTLHQPEACRVFSWGSCPWIMGPWQWWAAQASGRGGVDSDLCLLTGFLVAAAAAFTSHACLWGPCWQPWLSPVSGSPLSDALNPLSSRTRKQRGKKKSLVFSAGPDFFPDSLPASCGALTPSGCVQAANPSPLPGIWPKPEPQLPAPPHRGGWADKPLGLVSAGWHSSSMRESLRFALCTSIAAFSSVAPKLPPSATCSLRPRRGFLVCGNLSSFTAPSHWCRSCPYSFVSVFSFALPRCVGSFLPFGRSEVFCQHSVGVL